MNQEGLYDTISNNLSNNIGTLIYLTQLQPTLKLSEALLE